VTALIGRGGFVYNSMDLRGFEPLTS